MRGKRREVDGDVQRGAFKLEDFSMHALDQALYGHLFTVGRGLFNVHVHHMARRDLTNARDLLRRPARVELDRQDLQKEQDAFSSLIFIDVSFI